jgi:cell division control protein 24
MYVQSFTSTYDRFTNARKQYEIFLFECILLCCKEVSPGKSRDKKDKTRSQGPKIRNRNAKLQLKGRIFMANVTDVVSLSKPGKFSCVRAKTSI